MLVDKGAAPPDLRRYIVEEKYGPLTQDQWNDFVKISGKELKDAVLGNLSSLKDMEPAYVKSFMDKQGTVANTQAAAALDLDPMPHPNNTGVATSSGGSAAPGPSGSVPKAPRVSAPAGVTVPKVSSSGAVVGGGVASYSTQSPASSISRRTGLGTTGSAGGMSSRLRLKSPRGASLRKNRLVSGKLRPRSGRIRLASIRRRGRLSLKG